MDRIDFKELYKTYKRICDAYDIEQKPELIGVFDCFCHYSIKYADGSREMQGKSALDGADLKECKQIIDLLALLNKSIECFVGNNAKAKAIKLDNKIKNIFIEALNKRLLTIKPLWLQWILDERVQRVERFNDSEGCWERILELDTNIKLTDKELKELKLCIEEELKSQKIFKGMGKGYPYLGGIANEFAKAMTYRQLDLDMRPIANNSFIYELMLSSGCIGAFIEEGIEELTSKEKYQKINQWISTYKKARKKSAPNDDDFFKFHDEYYIGHLTYNRKKEMEEVFNSGSSDA